MTDTDIERHSNADPFHVPLPPEEPEPAAPWWTKPPGDLLGEPPPSSRPRIPPVPSVPPKPSEPPTVGVVDEEDVEEAEEAEPQPSPSSPLRTWARRIKAANAAAKAQREAAEEDAELPAEDTDGTESPSRSARRRLRLRKLRRRQDDEEDEPEQRQRRPRHRPVVHDGDTSAHTWWSETRHAVQPITRGLLYNGAAAWLGWNLPLGSHTFLGPMALEFFEAAGRETGVKTATVVALMVCGFVGWKIDGPTRTWWPPLAWLARIPLATCVIAVAFANTNP